MKVNKWIIDEQNWNNVVNIETKSRYDKNGIDKHGFNRDGIHIITGTIFDEDGYDRFGFNKAGVNKYGVTRDGKMYNGKSIREVRKEPGINGRLPVVLTELSRQKDRSQYILEYFPIVLKKNQERVFDENGVDQYGFNKIGKCINNNKYRDEMGYNALGYDKKGFDRNGYDVYGFKYDGYDEYGYDIDGRDAEGYDREGRNANGYTAEEEQKIKEQNEISRRRIYLGLRFKAEKLGRGLMSIEEYIKKSKMSVEDLIRFAISEGMDREVIMGLNKQVKPYKIYTRPFFKKTYLESAIILVEGKEVRPTEEDVDKCIRYLESQDSLICDKNVRETVRGYLRGEIEIDEKETDFVESTDDEIKEALVETLIGQQEIIRAQNVEIADLKTQRRSVYEK